MHQNAEQVPENLPVMLRISHCQNVLSGSCCFPEQPVLAAGCLESREIVFSDQF